MSVDSYRRAVEGHSKEIARLQQEKAREAAKVAEENKRANAAAEAATRTSSLSTARIKLREVERHNDKAAQHQKKVAELERKIAAEHGHLNDDQKRLATAQSQEDQKRIQADRKRAEARERAEREHTRRMNAITGKLTQHDHLHAVALSAIERLQYLPEQITVLFLAANPLDHQQLRLDEEARSIAEMIRKSEHRDAVHFESRWAVRPLDLLQAINEHQPRVVHFSGHGSDQDEIVFQDDSGHAKLVSKEAIVETMAAASGDIQLVFFNTCYSRGQAEAVVQHVPAAIGMNTSIGDAAARVFSAYFYSAIGFGLSVAQAFRQARAALMLEGIPEESTPELFATEGLDLDRLVLVQREGSPDPAAT